MSGLTGEELNKLKLAVFGDSIMNGSGNGNFGVGEYLKEEYGFKLYKYCVGGARVGYREGKNWLVEQVRQAVNDGIKPDIIIFNGFTNDCNMSDGVNCDTKLGEICPAEDIFSIERERADFTLCFISVLCAFKKYFPDAKLIFVRPHKMGRRDANAQVVYGERAIKLCKMNAVGVIDVYKESDLNTFLPDQRDKYTFDSYNLGKGDCTHPNGLGYREKYMPLIRTEIEKILNKSKK